MSFARRRVWDSKADMLTRCQSNPFLMYSYVYAGLGVSFVLSVVWLIFLRYFAGLMAWLTVLAANVLFFGCTILCYQKVWSCIKAHSYDKRLLQAVE